MGKEQTIENIASSRHIPANEGDLPAKPPEWFDPERFEAGKNFVKKYIFCIALAQFLSLFVGLSFNRLLKPLIFTRNSDTAKKALKRYALTAIHVNSWSIGNIFDHTDPARKSIGSVRGTHTKYAKIFNRSTDAVSSATVQSICKVQPSGRYIECIKADMKDSDDGTNSPMFCTVCKKKCDITVPLEYPDEQMTYVSQCDMSFTQLGFMGLLVMYPEKFGVHYASPKELDGFIHMWRVFGYMLGIKDEYNFCKDDNYADVRVLCFEAFHHCTKRLIYEATEDYEYMANVLTEGIGRKRPGISFQSCSLYLFDMVGWDMPRFNAVVSEKDMKSFRRMKYFFQNLLQYRVCQWAMFAFHKVYVWWFRRFMHRSGGDYKQAVKAFKDD